MSFLLKEVLFDGRPLKLSLSNSSSSSSNKVTVIIGKNSVGKSRLLSAITKSFQAVDERGFRLRRERGPFGRPKPPLSDFRLIYEVNDRSVCLSVDKGKVVGPMGFGEFWHDLPNKVIASSTSPFDKFPVDGRRLNEIDYNSTLYTYLGTKNVFGQHSSVAQLTRIVDSLFSASEKSPSDLDKLTNVFNFLGYEPRMRVEYRLRFELSKIEKMLSLPREEAIRYLERYSYSGLSMQRVLKDELLMNQALDAVKYITNIDTDYRSPTFEVNFCSGDFSDGSLDLYKHTNFLRNIGLMQLSDFTLYPKNNEAKAISIRDASSGEQCVIINILGIASEITNNSLICIDEPEISLHPEWQEQFIDLLIHTFSNYCGCHFLIATHSPQIVSKLSYENCYILTMDDGELRSSEAYTNRSADYQLANLFKSPGVRNEYLNRECVSLLTKISKIGRIEGDDRVKCEFLINFLPLLDDSDSVKQLIYIVKETLEKLN